MIEFLGPTGVVAAGVGLLAGLIYYFDGWVKKKDDIEDIWHSPRMKSAVYLLGGEGAALLLGWTSTNFREANIGYLGGAVVTFLVVSLLCSMIAWIYTVSCLRHASPPQPRRIAYWQALRAVPDVMWQGWGTFSQRLDEDLGGRLRARERELTELRAEIAGQTEEFRQALKAGGEAAAERLDLEAALRSAERQRDTALKFLAGHCDGLATRIYRGSTNIEDFVEFTVGMLEVFVVRFLESDNVDGFRACLYVRERNSGSDLRFLAGYAPTGSHHTRASLDGKESLAAHALNDPTNLHTFPGQVPFVERNGARFYKSVKVCALHPLSAREMAFEAVLCVDSASEDFARTIGFEDKLILTVSQLLDDAVTLFGLTWQNLEQWLDAGSRTQEQPQKISP